MFLSRRATQAEYFDSPERTAEQIASGYRELASVNRKLVFAEPFQRLMPKFFGSENCQSLSILDLGAGDGSLGNVLARWAATKYDWKWRITNLDFNFHALRLNTDELNVAASAIALPFRDESFDVVIASQMTHHLTTDDELVRHLSEAWRVSRRGIYITDLHRNVFVYWLIWLLLHTGRYSKDFREDGLLSIKRGFRMNEMRALVAKAGITGGQVSVYYGSRLIVQAKKF